MRYFANVTAILSGKGWMRILIICFAVAANSFQVNAQLSLTSASNTQTITFGATLTGVSNGAYSSAGFAASPAAGGLDSDAWAVTGWSDGSLAFGGTQNTGTTDYRRGQVSAAVITGGMYHATMAPHSAGNPALLIQPGTSDWAPGTITLRIINGDATSNITSLAVSYNLFVRNDQARSNSFNFSYSTDNSSYTAVGALDYTSTAALDALGYLQVGTSPSKSTTISSLTIAPGAYIYIRWSGADVGGSGSRDEFGLDDIAVTATYGAATPTLSITGNAATFGNVCTNVTSSSSSLKFTINGSNLTTADVTLAALSGFTYSTTNGGTYTSTLSLTQSGGTYTQDIFVLFSPSAVQSYDGNAVVGGGGASNVNAAITGSGINTTATLTATPTSASITTISAVLGGNATSIGCSNLTERGIYWSATNGFTPPGQGTKVSSTGSFGTGAFTETVISGLSSGTTYYFKSFATNSGGTVYSNQGSFTTLKDEPTNSPSSFACGTTTSSSIPLSWVDASGGTTPDGYLVKWSTTSYAAITAPLDLTAESNGTGVQNVTQGTQAYTFTSLASSTTHYFKIWSYTNSGSNIDYKLSPAPEQTSCATLAGPCVNEGFSGGTTAPSGWTFTTINGTYTAGGSYGAASPSLQMDATGDAVQTPVLSNGATSLSFWIKGQGTNSTSALLVEGYNGSSWVTVENITNSLPTTGTTKTYNSSSSPALPSGLTQFRFTYTKSVGNLAFDDALAYCSTGTSDIIENTTYSSSTPYFNINTAYISYTDATSTTSGKVIPMGIEIRDGGLSGDSDGFGTELTAVSFTVKNMSGTTNLLNYIKTAILTTTGGTLISPATKVGSELVFSSMSGSSSNYTAAQGGTKILHLRVSFDETQVTDNEKLVYKVSYASANSSGSAFAATDAGGAQSDNDNSPGNNRNRIEVVATALAFVQEATNTATNSSMSPSPTVEAIDDNGKRDLDYVTQMSITSTGDLNGTTVNSTPSSGLATFGSIIHNSSGIGLSITVSSGSLSTDQSGPFDISAQTTSTDYFISRVNGNWITPATWQSSPDQINWITATLAPTQAANTVKISHNVTINSSVTIDQVTVQNGGTITYAGGGSNDLFLNNGTGTDWIIENGGRLLITTTNQGLFKTSGSGNPSMLIKTGGMIEAQTSGAGEADGYASDEHPYDGVNTYDDLITWEDGAILYWNTSEIISASGFTYFWNTPNATDKPILRFNGNTSIVGGLAGTLIWGILEVSSGKTLNWSGTGTKEIVFGITGSGSVAMSTAAPASGQIIISGDGAVLSGGTLTLNSNGLSIPSGASVTLTSNKAINSGPISVAGTFDLTDKAISGNYTAFSVSGLAYVKTAHPNGLRSAIGALQNDIATYNLSATGTTVEYNRMGTQIVTNNNYQNLLFIGGGDKTLAGNTNIFGNLSWIDLNGIPVLKCGSNTLVVFGNWDNEGATDFDRGTGTVYFGQTSNTRTISDANSFNNLRIFGTVNIATGTQNIYDRLEVPTGSILNAYGKVTLQSGGSLLHGVNTSLGGGIVNGNIIVNRSGSTGARYNYWSTPVSGAAASVLGGTTYYYNPTNAPDLTESGLRQGWVASSGTMTSALGYISQGGGNISFPGPANDGTITVPIKRNVGTSNNVAWNLVGNPYPCSLDASVFMSVNGPVGSSPVVTGSLYFWDDDGTGGPGWAATQDYGIWSGAGFIGPNSGKNFAGHIASGQSFFLEKLADGTSNVEFRNTMRSASNNIFFRQKPIERFWINVTTPHLEYNETLIAFIDDATDSLDLVYDARKLKGNANISLYTKLNNDNYAIQAFPELLQDRIIAVGLDAGKEGTHILRLKKMENMDETVTLILEDSLLNYFQNLNENPDYEFYTEPGIDISRFFIHTNPPMQINSTEESCSGLDAEISILQPGSKTWDYVLYDKNEQPITSGTGFNGNLAFSGLMAGDYRLELTDQFGFSVSKKVTVSGKTDINADFIPTYSIAPADQEIRFVNNTSGATSFDWDFGDGTILTGVREPYHTYTEKGNYTVTLHAYNNDCDDQVSQEISVYKIASGIQGLDEDKVFVSTFGEFILIRFDYRSEKRVELTVHNVLGQKVYETATLSSGDFKIDLPGKSGQYYFLTINDGNKALTAKVILMGN